MVHESAISRNPDRCTSDRHTMAAIMVQSSGPTSRIILALTQVRRTTSTRQTAVSVPHMARICAPLLTSGGSSDSPVPDMLAGGAHACRCWLGSQRSGGRRSFTPLARQNDHHLRSVRSGEAVLITSSDPASTGCPGYCAWGTPSSSVSLLPSAVVDERHGRDLRMQSVGSPTGLGSAPAASHRFPTVTRNKSWKRVFSEVQACWTGEQILDPACMRNMGQDSTYPDTIGNDREGSLFCHQLQYFTHTLLWYTTNFQSWLRTPHQRHMSQELVYHGILLHCNTLTGDRS